MKTNKIYLNIILTIAIFLFIFGYRMHFNKENYYKIFNFTEDNYKKMYEEILKNYDLMIQNYNIIPAKVLNPSVNKINNIFLINKGKMDNIKKNSFVVNEEGLVGEVIKVYNKFSVVKLITSSNINLAVEINECFGTLKKEKNKYVIKDLINCNDVKKGDAVFTSRYNYSSSNILIGNVVNIKNNIISIKYRMNPYKLQYLGVINDLN